MKQKTVKSEKVWRKVLTPEEFHVLRKGGTETEFTGKYLDNRKKGIYFCAGCRNKLFLSDTKYDSGIGWPSFWAPASKDNIKMKSDNNFRIQRTEILCSQCGGHLGHVFNDSPKPTGLHFCINSAALHFKEKGQRS